MLSSIVFSRWLLGLPTDLLERFDEQLDEVWEPFLADEDDPATAPVLSFA